MKAGRVGDQLVSVTVELPADLAAQAFELERERPGRLARILRIELTRRAIYKERHQLTDHELAVLRENGAMPPRGGS